MKEQSIQIIVDPQNRQTKIGSQTQDPWEDLGIVLEGLSFLIILNAHQQKKAPNEIKKYCFDYLEKAIKDCKVKID